MKFFGYVFLYVVCWYSLLCRFFVYCVVVRLCLYCMVFVIYYFCYCLNGYVKVVSFLCSKVGGVDDGFVDIGNRFVG